MPSSIGQNVSF